EAIETAIVAQTAEGEPFSVEGNAPDGGASPEPSDVPDSSPYAGAGQPAIVPGSGPAVGSDRPDGVAQPQGPAETDPALRSVETSPANETGTAGGPGERATAAAADGNAVDLTRRSQTKPGDEPADPAPVRSGPEEAI